MGDDQHRPLILIDQLSQSSQISEIQKHIRFVQYQQIRCQQHFPHDLQHLIFSAADIRQLRLRQITHPGHCQRFSDLAFVMIPVHGFILIQKLLVLFIQRIQILSLRHRSTYGLNILLQRREPLTEKFKHGTILKLISHAELAGIADPAAFIPHYFPIIEVLLRMDQNLRQRGFACSVAADKRTVLPRFQCERNVLI